MLAAPTPSDLDLPEAQSLTELTDALAGVPFRPTMAVCALLAAELYHHPRDRERQLELSEALHPSALHERMRDFLAAGPERMLFDPRHVAALQRLLVIHAAPDPAGVAEEWTAPEVEHVHILGSALLDLAGVLPQLEPTDSEGVLDLSEPSPEVWSAWAAYTTRAGAWYSEPEAAEAIARTHALYIDLHQSEGLSTQHDRTDVESLARASTGLTLAEQAAGALAYGAISNALLADATIEQRLARLGQGALANGSMAEKEPLLRAAISASRDELAQLIAAGGQTPERVAWDHTAFDRRPFLRAHDGTLLCCSPRALVAWMTSGIHHRSAEAAGRRPHPTKPGKTSRPIFSGYTGALGEELVRQMLRRSHQTAERANACRLHGERGYRIGKKLHRSPDAAIDSGTDLVLFEVYSGRIPLSARADPSAEPMLSIIKRFIIDKLGELAARTAELLNGHLSYDDVDLTVVRRVWPVLVLAGDPIMQTVALWQHLRAAAPQLFRQDRRVQRPTIMDLDSLEPVLARVEAGETLPDLLAQYLASAHAEVSVRHWLQSARPGSLDQRPIYVTEHYERASELARSTLFDRA